MPKEAIEAMIKMFPSLESKDIADAVVYLLSTPQNVLVTELTIRPMNETM
jgi:NADP-dependent 3-hydroxy acid dehydrogenase YdfG